MSFSRVISSIGNKMILATLALTLMLMPIARGQANEQEDKTIDSKRQAEIIDSVSAALDQIYVFPDVAKKMEKHLRKQLKSKKYSELTSLRDFTQKLTDELREISHDKHLRIIYVTDETISHVLGDTLDDEAARRDLEESRRENFGYQEVKILDGNIGYVDLRRFSNTGQAGMTAIAAMNFLAYTDAVIFDLRRNGGGSPSMIQLILSYFLDEPTHINTFYVRETDSLQQFWTQTYVQGPKMLDTDVYVLTSEYTFSAAEEFSYDIKNLERGMIIGEVTGGGAHPNDRRLFAKLNVGMSLPFGRAINPISGTNWEGVGVIPDIEVPQEQAFDRAYLEALNGLKEKATDEDELRVYQWAYDGQVVKLNPVAIELSQFGKYVGTYGPRKITLENDIAYYQREDNPRYRLIPMGDHRFMLDGLDYFRIQFVEDDSGEIVKLIGQYKGGYTDGNQRDN